MFREEMFVVPGKPTPLYRPRFSRRGTYNPQKEALAVFSLHLHSQFSNKKPFAGSTHLEVIFHMPIPQSLSKKKQKKLFGMYHIKRPDLSNLIKFIEDAGNEIIFTDDCLITSIDAKKIYSFEPRTEIIIKETGDDFMVSELKKDFLNEEKEKNY